MTDIRYSQLEYYDTNWISKYVIIVLDTSKMNVAFLLDKNNIWIKRLIVNRLNSRFIKVKILDVVNCIIGMDYVYIYTYNSYIYIY